MKEKLIFIPTGSVCEYGDSLVIATIHRKGNETIRFNESIEVTPQSVPKLIKRHLISVQKFGEEDKYKDIPRDINAYLKSLNMNPEIHLPEYIWFHLLLREIAEYIDKMYEGDISKCDVIYVVSTTNGKIMEIPRNNIKNFRNFAAFRSKEDAELACTILKPLITRMYASRK